MKCVCGHSPWGHLGQTGVCCDGNIKYCTCVTYEADDGTPTPGSSCNPDFKSDPYNGQYASNGKYQP